MTEAVDADRADPVGRQARGAQEHRTLQELSDNQRLRVPEKIGDGSGAWNDQAEERRFAVKPPSNTVPATL